MTAPLQPAARYMDIVVQAGDDRPIEIPVFGRDGQPRDITGWSARAVVRAHRRGGAVLHEWSPASGNAECGPAGVVLLVDDSASWAWRRGEWDLVLTDTNQAQRVEAYGSIHVRELMTQ